MEKSFKALGAEIKISFDDEIDKTMSDEKDSLQPDNDTAKTRNGKSQTNIDVLNDSDIPYEVRMKYIIDAYRKDQVKWGKLMEYAKHLEKEVIRLKSIMIANGYTDSGNEDDYKPAKVIKELTEKNSELEERVKELNKALDDPEGRIKVLEDRIFNVYPKRKIKIASLKKVIRSKELYIEDLQRLLDENGIAYPQKTPVNDIEAMGADNIDENAVR